MKNNIIDWSYQSHSQQENHTNLPSCYTNPNSIDAWRHNRMLATILPLIYSFPNSTWMTVGDGRYGSDAHYLQTHSVDVLATSITDSNLKIAYEKKYITKFHAENAEKISFPDACFDFVLCKESYHHFPRPAIALYEMLRVSRKGVILIEPYDSQSRVLDIIKKTVKKLLRGDKSDLFESGGNYIYRLSVREVEKIATALNLSSFAYKRFNDFFHPKLAKQEYRDFSFGTMLTKSGIFTQDILSFLHLTNYGLITLIIFKEPISDDANQRLASSGFKREMISKNPYD